MAFEASPEHRLVPDPAPRHSAARRQGRGQERCWPAKTPTRSPAPAPPTAAARLQGPADEAVAARSSALPCAWKYHQDAVHHEHHRRLRPCSSGARSWRRPGGNARRLHRNQNKILRPQIPGVNAGRQLGVHCFRRLSTVSLPLAPDRCQIAPRATTETSAPPRERYPARTYPTTDPAPKTQMRI